MNKNLSYFMREHKEEIITVPAPETFTDENGKRLEMKVKILSNERIRKINESYRKRSIALDSKGNPYISNGEVLFKTEHNSGKAYRHIIAEALVEPDLGDKELMAFYNCYDKAEMVLKVFSEPGEYDYVFNTIMSALSLMKSEKNDDKELIEEAKN